MVYPRAFRPKVEPRTIDVAAHTAAFNKSAAVDARLAALWELRGARAFTVVDGRTLAEHLGDVLNEDLVLASEAHEALLALDIPGGDPSRDLAVLVDKRGSLGVAGKPLDAVAGNAGPNVQRVVALAKVMSLAASTSAPVVQWPKTVAGSDLVVERAAHPKMPAGVLRLRGDEALVGSMRDTALKLPIARRHLRLRRSNNDVFTVVDVYAEGFVTVAGAVATQPISLKNGTRIDVAGEGLLPAAVLTARTAPRLDRSTGVTLRFRDQGRRTERLAIGEALFFGAGVDDDVATPVRARLVATPEGAVLVSSAPLPQVRAGVAVVGNVGVKFDGDDVTLLDNP